MSGETHRTPHSLLPLFPRFLTKRRRGFAGIAPLLAETGLSRPALFLVLRVATGPTDGSTAEELRPGAPYAARDPHVPLLAEAVERDFLFRDEAGRYRAGERGRAVAARIEGEAVAYLAGLRPIPDPDLSWLAERFAAIAAGLDVEAGGPGSHLARSRRIAALAPATAENDAHLVRLERAIYDLWTARDDAHIGAWRAARFPGPTLDVLTRLWRGDADTPEELRAALAETIEGEDIDAIVEELAEQGYVERRGGELRPTRAGYLVREGIEATTDELYFRQWPPLEPDEIARLHNGLGRLIDSLPDVPSQG